VLLRLNFGHQFQSECAQFICVHVLELCLIDHDQ